MRDEVGIMAQVGMGFPIKSVVGGGYIKGELRAEVAAMGRERMVGYQLPGQVPLRHHPLKARHRAWNHQDHQLFIKAGRGTRPVLGTEKN